MKKRLQCLLYLANGQVDGYLYESHTLKKISTYENFSSKKILDLWDWWIGSISYIYERDLMDICVAGDCEKFAFPYDESVDFGQQTNWTLYNVQDIFKKLYPAIQHDINSLTFGQEIICNNPVSAKQGNDSLFPVRQIRLFMPHEYYDFFCQKNRRIGSKQETEEECNNLEEGLLYKYFNRETKFAGNC